MSLGRVELVSEVLRTITTHALTTECEEIMGLLLGDIRVEGNTSMCRIWRVLPQIRSDRRKDRVELNQHQLHRSISKAEKLTQTTGVRTRVVGWYHSHPKITVQPSHVDLKTQAEHQSLDDGFVGLIVSCFNADQVLKCTAFQATTEPPEIAGNDSGSLGIEETDDEEIKKALMMSIHEYKGYLNPSSRGQLHHKEVPLKVIRPEAIGEYSLMDTAQLHNVLTTEEEQAYKKTLDNQKNVSNLIRLHQGSVYIQSLIHLMNSVLVPDLNSLLALKKQNEMNLGQLDEQIEYYKNMKSRTPSPDQQYLAHCPSISPSDISQLHDDLGVSTQLSLEIYKSLTSSPPIGQAMEIETNQADNGVGNGVEIPRQNGLGITQGRPDFSFHPPGPRHHLTDVHPAPMHLPEQYSVPNPVAPPQHIPFVTMPKPPDSSNQRPLEATSPNPSAFANYRPRDGPPGPTPAPEFSPFVPRLSPIRARTTDNANGYSAGIRREKALREDTTNPTHLQSRPPNEKGRPQGHVQKIPRMNDQFEDLWKESRDEVQRR